MNNLPFQPTMTKQQSMFCFLKKRNADELSAGLETSPADIESCKKLCQEQNPVKEEVNMDKITDEPLAGLESGPSPAETCKGLSQEQSQVKEEANMYETTDKPLAGLENGPIETESSQGLHQEDTWVKEEVKMDEITDESSDGFENGPTSSRQGLGQEDTLVKEEVKMDEITNESSDGFENGPTASRQGLGQEDTWVKEEVKVDEITDDPLNGFENGPSETASCQGLGQEQIVLKEELNVVIITDEEPLAELENVSSDTESCTRHYQKQNMVNGENVTEITVTLSDSEDPYVAGKAPSGANGLRGNNPLTFSEIFAAHNELPMCWTEDQANYFRKQNPWLQIRNGRLGCAVCVQVGTLSLHQHVRGSRLAREWLEFMIGSNSETRKGQQTALRKKIWEHRESNAHQQAEKLLVQAQAGLFDTPITPAESRSEEQETTCRIFRTAYMTSKQNRPYSDMPDLVDLQMENGIDMGRVLHSRKSCAEICDFIGNEMKKKITAYMIEKDVKFSVLVEECTTVSSQSALVVCLRAAFGEKSEPLTIFFQLLELPQMTDEAIAAELQTCLNEHFPKDFIARNWISFTADGASATMGWPTGVATLLNMSDCYPNLVIWHCCNHKLELAAGDAVKEVTGTHDLKTFIEGLYALYQSSPKNQRELHSCAEELAVLFKATSRALDTTWVASSCRTVTALWNIYAALAAHFKSATADQKRASSEKAKYKGLLTRLTSVEFVKNLGIMRDALKKLSELSLRLQVNSITPPEAHTLICHQIQVFQALAGEKEAEFTKTAAKSARNQRFQGVPLHSGRKLDVEINRGSFFQSLTNSLQNRLMTASSHVLSTSDRSFFPECVELFPACKVAYPQYWPEELDIQYGEDEVLGLCRRFQLPAQQVVQGFREYKDNGGRQVPEAMLPLITTLKTIAISTAECERVFSDMNSTITSIRSSLHINRVSNLLFLQRNGPPFAEFRPESYVTKWLLQGRRSADHVACRERENKDEEFANEKKYLWSLF